MPGGVGRGGGRAFLREAGPGRRDALQLCLHNAGLVALPPPNSLSDLPGLKALGWGSGEGGQSAPALRTACGKGCKAPATVGGHSQQETPGSPAGVHPGSKEHPGLGFQWHLASPLPLPPSAGLSFPTGPRGAAFSKPPPGPWARLDPASRGAQAAGATPPTRSHPGVRPLQPGVRTQEPGAETRTSTSARQCGPQARGARPQPRHRAATGWGGGNATVPAGCRLTPYGRTGVGMEGGARLGPETKDSARPGLRVRRSGQMLGLRPGAGPGGVRERAKDPLAPPTASAPPTCPAAYPAAAGLFPAGGPQGIGLIRPSSGAGSAGSRSNDLGEKLQCL